MEEHIFEFNGYDIAWKYVVAMRCWIEADDKYTISIITMNDTYKMKSRDEEFINDEYTELMGAWNLYFSNEK